MNLNSGLSSFIHGSVFHFWPKKGNLNLLSSRLIYLSYAKVDCFCWLSFASIALKASIKSSFRFSFLSNETHNEETETVSISSP